MHKMKININQKIQAVMPELLAATQITVPTGRTMSKEKWIEQAKSMHEDNSQQYMEYQWLTFLHYTLYPNCSTRFVNQLHNVVYNMLVEETA